MNILSLFDGISVAQQAIQELGIGANYYASEIDPYAIAITQHNFPETVQLGDVQKIKAFGSVLCYKSDETFPDENMNVKIEGGIDLLVGGSPCTDLSVAKNHREGLSGEKSRLFYEYVRILEEVRPRFFLFENVKSMRSCDRDEISRCLGVEPIMIDAQKVSAQHRERLYWTNILGVEQPEDDEIMLEDILLDGYTLDEKSRTITASYSKGAYIGNLGTHRERTMVFTKPEYLHLRKDQLAKEMVRNLYAVELERLQSLPDYYTYFGETKKGRVKISDFQRKRALGNAFNCAVIKHILRNIEQKK